MIANDLAKMRGSAGDRDVLAALNSRMKDFSERKDQVKKIDEKKAQIEELRIRRGEARAR